MRARLRFAGISADHRHSLSRLLSAQAPASFVAWDLLALGDDDLRRGSTAIGILPAGRRR